MNSQIILLAITLSAVCATVKDGKHRVFNGEAVQIGELKHLVKINSITGMCSGSIIDPNWILTAAHCVYRVKPGTRHKILHHSQSKPIAHASKSYHNPKFHWPGNSQHLTARQVTVDLALLKLDKPIKFDKNIQPIKLVNRVPAVNGIAVIAGYGETNMAPVSQQYERPFKGSLRIGKCPRGYEGLSAICTNSLVGAGRGDSGGPLMTEEGLIGVQSASGCVASSRRQPCMTYCVNVADPGNLAWIRQVLGKK